MRRAPVVVVLLAMIPAAVGGCGSSAPSHRGLTDRQFTIAVAIARNAGKTSFRSVTEATATVGSGTVTGISSSTGHSCISGTLLNIKVLGVLNPNITHLEVRAAADDQRLARPNTLRAEPSASNDMQDVEITADAVTGVVCVEGVRYSDATADLGATVLFTG